MPALPLQRCIRLSECSVNYLGLVISVKPLIKKVSCKYKLNERFSLPLKLFRAITAQILILLSCGMFIYSK